MAYLSAERNWCMELGLRDSLLTVASALAFLVGIGFVLSNSTTLTAIGIVLIVVSSIVFIVDLKDLVLKTDEHTDERARE